MDSQRNVYGWEQQLIVFASLWCKRRLCEQHAMDFAISPASRFPETASYPVFVSRRSLSNPLHTVWSHAVYDPCSRKWFLVHTEFDQDLGIAFVICLLTLTRVACCFLISACKPLNFEQGHNPRILWYQIGSASPSTISALPRSGLKSSLGRPTDNVREYYDVYGTI